MKLEEREHDSRKLWGEFHDRKQQWRQKEANGVGWSRVRGDGGGGTKERRQIVRRGRRGGGGRGGARMGRGFVKCERLEAHLNSGCVSPALAECYLLQHGNRGDGKGEGG